MATDIQKQLDDIAAMQTAFEQDSCKKYKPMVEYPKSGNPPILDFNIPQSTSFVTYGKFAKFIDVDWFLPFTKAIPTYNFFSYVKTLSPQSVTQLFHPNVAAPAPVLGTFVPQNGPVPTNFVPTSQVVASAAPHQRMAMPAQFNARLASTLNTAQPIQQSQSVVLQPQTNIVASPITDLALQGIRGFYTHRVMNAGAKVLYVAQPARPVPQIMVIEEYTTSSYLGNYGAGRVIKTFSLFPGEKTTISVRTYRDEAYTAAKADNVLDSFSETSATELDNLIQAETGESSSQSASEGGNSTSYNTYSDSHNSNTAWNVSAKVNLFNIVSVGGGYGKSTSETSTSGGGSASSTNYNRNGARASAVNTLSSALEKSVHQSNANRQISVASSTSHSVNTGEENITVREIQNVNLNRTLNLTCRQLLQQYTVITHLSGVKFAYTNGYPESAKMVDLSNLPNMLLDLIDTSTDPDRIDKVMCLLLKDYCNVINYEDDLLQFIDAKEISVGGCLATYLPICEPSTELLWRKNPECIDNYTDGVINIDVNGVILKVQKQTLLTSSMFVDAMMGAGDALDCFNQSAQNATTMGAYINNLQSMQMLNMSNQGMINDQAAFTQNLTNQMDQFTQDITNQQAQFSQNLAIAQDVADQKLDVIDQILSTPDPVSAATLYKKVYGDCCDVPQNTDCGCGGC